jgi:AcrR family transcriptional regulator
MAQPRGRPRGLTLEQISDAVLEDGIATFSMPSIARRLGVAHSGLYRYIRDREELLVLSLDRIASEATWPSPDLPWRAQLRGIGETLWTIAGRYPGYADAAVASKHVSPGFVAAVTPHIASLHRQGLDQVAATAAVEFVSGLVVTSSIAADRLRRVKDQADLPEHTIPGFDDPELWTGRAWYARHLDVYLDGLASSFTADD